MQIKTFTVPIYDNDEATDEMNKFLAINKVLEVSQFFNVNENCWCFCVKYLTQIAQTTPNFSNSKVDYKQILSEKEFADFSILRKCRKQMSEEMALKPYMIFTDEELSGIVKLPVIELDKIRTVKGVGEKKYEKYGTRIFELYNQLKEEENNKNNETN